MSTYTDLHNKIKETLTVGYNDDDRITTQKVRFYNEGNEYWGTFKGTLRAEQVDLAGGKLTDVQITNATLSNISWPGGVDFDAFGAMIQSVSNEVNSINDVKIPSIHERITDEISARIKGDDRLESMILNTDTRLSIYVDKIEDDMRRELSALKMDVTHQEKLLSLDLTSQMDVLSTFLSSEDYQISTALYAQDYQISTALSAQDYALSVEFNDKIDELSRHVDDVDERLTNDVSYLSTELSTTQHDLVEEIYSRARADAAINSDIRSLSAISDARDNELQNNIDQLNSDAMLSIDILRDETTEKIEVERHYKYVQKAASLKDLGSYPFTLDDYAVNQFVFKDIDGQVYIDEYGKKFVASAKKTGDSLLPIDIIPYKENKGSPLFNSAFDTARTYTFTEEQKTNLIPTTGYSLTIEHAVTGSDDELSNYQLLLEPVAENYHEVWSQGTSKIGFVTNAYPFGTQTNLISGYLTISPASDTSYEDFKYFRNIEFNNTTLSDYFDEEHSLGFIYQENNKIELRRYDPPVNYLLLSDEYDSHAVVTTFGKIYEQIAGEKSVISTATEGVTSIKVLLNDYTPGTPHVLKKIDNFEEVLDDSYVTPTGDIAVITLKANVDNESSTAVFTIGQQSTLWKYNFTGKDESGTIKPLGSIVPHVYNRKITSLDTDFDTISAYISEVVYFDSMKQKLNGQPLVLVKSEVPSETGIWYGTLVDDTGNVLDVKYIGIDSELRLRLTVRDESQPEVGQIIAQKYKVDLDPEKARPVDGTGEKLIIYQTKPVNLTEFPLVERNYSSEVVLIKPEIADSSRTTFVLKFDTSSNTAFKAVIPPKPVEGKNALREFVLDIYISSDDENDTTFRKFILIDENGAEVEIVNTTQVENAIYVNPNRRALYAVKEVAFGKFAILDFNDEEDNHWIDVLAKRINWLSGEVDTLSANLSADLSALSVNLSTDIDYLSVNLSTDLSVLSAQISADVFALSSNLSTDIDQLSASISNDISCLSAYISADVDRISVDISTDLSTLSVNLSTDLSTLSAQISADVFALSVNLSTDIDYLSTSLSTDLSVLSVNLSTDISVLSVNLSTDLSTLSAQISAEVSAVSADLDNLSVHYYTTLSTDVALIKIFHDEDPETPDITRPLSVDQLVIVDEVTFERYRLTIRNGALNINKIDKIIFDD